MAAQRKLSLAAVEAICGKVAEGMSARKALEEAKVSRKAFYAFITATEKAKETYERALSIARLERVSGLPFLVFDYPDMDAPRLRVLSDNIKWEAARMEPKKYGDSSHVDLTARISFEEFLDRLPPP